LVSGCKSFPAVKTKFVNAIKQPDGPGVKHYCVYENESGELERRDEADCGEIMSCTICNEEGECETYPIEDCDSTIGYNSKDHERILVWGRTNCSKKK
jgi:hypothetical protein